MGADARELAQLLLRVADLSDLIEKSSPGLGKQVLPTAMTWIGKMGKMGPLPTDPEKAFLVSPARLIQALTESCLEQGLTLMDLNRALVAVREHLEQ